MRNLLSRLFSTGARGWSCFLSGLVLIGVMGAAAAAGFDEGLTLIRENRFTSIEQGVERLTSSGDPRALAVLTALLEGRLYLRKGEERLVTGREVGDSFQISDPLSGEDLGRAEKSEFKRLAINNKLRTQIRRALAGLSLSHPDPATRLAAVNEMLDKMDAEALALLQERIKSESDTRVQDAMRVEIAVAQLSLGSTAERLAAIEQLEGHLHPAVHNALQRLLEVEPDQLIQEPARQALDRIESRRQWLRLAETLFFGLSLGSILVLTAIGLAITFGVMGVINMAHGELMMLGAYTTYIVQQLMPGQLGWSLIIAIPAAFLVSGLAGILIERTVIRFLYGRPLETLLATFGLSLVLQQLVRTLISPQNVPVANPDWMAGSLQINLALSLTLNRLYILAFCLLVFAALVIMLRRTSLGLQVRAVAQNRAMAKAMGVRAGRVDALAFGLGSGIAGVAGVALSQLTNVGPNLGQSYIIDTFMVVVFGGVGNLWGTLVGGLTLGVANKVLEPWSGAVLAKILVLVFIILFIQKRPRGLFPQRGRAAES